MIEYIPLEINERSIFVGKEQYDFNSVAIGDIIWAKRYKTKEEKLRIPEHHRLGPYIVLAKTPESLICLRGTSTDIKNEKLFFVLENQNYSLAKETVFDLMGTDAITADRFFKKVDSLKESDKKRLYKQVKISKLNYKYNGINKRFDLPHEAGDIIYYRNTKFIIVSALENKLVCVPVEKPEKRVTLEQCKLLDYKKITFVDPTLNINTISVLDDNELKFVLKKYKEFLRNVRNENKIGRGSVVLYNDNNYYIYGEEGSLWLAFLVESMTQDGLEKININNKFYYTNFYTNEKISKKERLTLINQSSSEEIDIIKKARKNYANKPKEKNDVEEKIIRAGDLVQYKNKAKERYFVINVYDGLLECLSVNELINANRIMKFFKTEDVKLANNKSLVGIKWFEENYDIDYKYIARTNILNEVLYVQRCYVESLMDSNTPPSL